jgi:aryl-alcohol dehydrogenase-like predicted oxidoreductase
VRQRRLGTNGPEVGAVGLGCMGMTTAYDTNERDDEESVRVIHRAIELGVVLIDTAEVYGPYENEELVGRALAEGVAEGDLRERVVLATKTGIALEGMKIRPDGRPERIREAIDGSLRRLGADHVDLYYLHRVGSRRQRSSRLRRLTLSIRSRQCSRRCRCGPVTGSRQVL